MDVYDRGRDVSRSWCKREVGLQTRCHARRHLQTGQDSRKRMKLADTPNSSKRNDAGRYARQLASVFILALIAFTALGAFGQMSRKPSPSHEPEGAMDKKPDSKKNSLVDIRSQAEFDSIARVYHQN